MKHFDKALSDNSGKQETALRYVEDRLKRKKLWLDHSDVRYL